MALNKLNRFRYYQLLSWSFLACIISSWWFSVSVAAKSGYSNSIDYLALTQTDATLQDLKERYERSEHYNFWHPNTYNSDSHSREVVSVESVKYHSTAGDYKQWKSARFGHKTIFVGLRTDSIHVFDGKLRPLEVIETTATLETLTTFSQWNDHLGKAELIIIAVTKMLSLLVFSFMDGRAKHLGTWPLQHAVQSLELCVVELSRKVIVIPQNPRASVDVYNFERHNSTSQFWFFQRLKMDNRTCVAVQELDSGCKVAYTTNNELSIWSYEPHLRMFQEHSTFYNITSQCKQLVPFRLAYSKYFALVPQQENRSVEFYGETGKELLVQRGSKLVATEIGVAPVNDYKGEDVLIATTPKNETKIYAFDGVARIFKEGFSCTKDECVPLQLSSGTSAVVNGTTLFIAPPRTPANYSAVLLIETHTEEHLSPLFQKFRKFYNHFLILADLYKRFQLAVMEVSTALDDALSLTDLNTITGNWTVKQIKTVSATVQQPLGPNVGSVVLFQTPLRAADFAVTDKQIQDELNSMERTLQRGREDVSQTVPLNSSEIVYVTAPQRINGNIRASHIDSQKVTTNAINEVTQIQRLFNDLATRSSNGTTVIRVNGDIRFQGLTSTDNLKTAIINGVPTESFALKSKSNVFQTPIVFFDNFRTSSVVATKVSGLRIPEEVLLASNVRGVTLSGGVVATVSAVLEEPVTGIRIDQNLGDEIFSRNGNQTVMSRISFESVTLRREAKFFRLNANEFTKLMNSIVLRNHSGPILGEKTAVKSTADVLFILKTLNAVSFPDGFVRRNQQVVTIYGVKNFSRVEANNVKINGSLNDRNPNDIVTPSSHSGHGNTCNWTTHGPVVLQGDTRVREAMNGKNVSHLGFHDSLDKDKTHYQSNHNIRFESPVVIENLQVTGKINGKTFQEAFGQALTCESGHDLVVNGTTRFKNDLNLGNIIVTSGKVNNSRLRDFLNRNKDQNITSNVIFASPVAFHDVIATAANVDGTSIDDALRDAILLDEDQIWPPQLHFDSIFAPLGTFVEGPVNQFDNFSSVIAVTTGRAEQVFTSSIQTTKLEALSLSVTSFMTSSTINNVNIQKWLQQRISLSKDVRFTQPVEITGNTTARKDIQTGSLNDHSLQFLWAGVLRSNHRHQVFQSPVVLYGTILTEESILIRSRLNDFVFDKIVQDSIPVNNTELINITKHWNMEMAVFKNLTVLGKTCDVNLSHLAADSVKNGESRVDFTSPVEFISNVTVLRDSSIGSLNGMPGLSQLFSLHGDQTIASDFVWTEDVKIERSLVVEGRMNNISLSKLGSRYSFSNNTHHLHFPNVTFESTFHARDLQVGGLIIQTNLTEFLNSRVKLRSRKAQKVVGSLNFTVPIVSRADISVTRINGIRVAALANALVTKGENVVFEQPVCFLAGLETDVLIVENGSITTENGRIGNLSLEEMRPQALPISSDTPVNLSKLSLVDAQVISGVTGVRTINGIPIDKLLTKRTPQSIRKLKFARLWINQSEVAVKRHFGRVSLADVVEDTVLMSGPQTIVTGKKTFTGKVLVRGNLHANKSIVEQLIFLGEKKSQEINSAVVFADNINVMGNMVVRGTWNGHSLDDIEKRRVSRRYENSITGNWTFGQGLVLKRGAKSYGLIDGLNASHVDRRGRAYVEKFAEGMMSEQEEYGKVCRYFQMLYDESARSPLYLHSFDEHQTITLRANVQKMLTVTVSNIPFLFVASYSCQVRSFTWSAVEELFYEGETILTGASVNKWEGFSMKTEAVVVFSTIFNTDCKDSLATGLHVAMVTASGEVSLSEMIMDGDIVDFKIVYASSSAFFLFVVSGNQPDTLIVMSWDVASRKFIDAGSVNVSSIKAIHAASFDEEKILVLLQSDSSVSVTTYKLLEKRFSGVRESSFGRSIGEIKFFHSDSSLFAISSRKLTGEIQPTFTLQLLRVKPSGEEVVQELQTYNVVAVEVAHLGDQIYVLVLTKPAGLYVYKFMGLSGLQQVSPYPLKFHHGECLSVFHIVPWSYDVSLPFAVVCVRNRIKVIHPNVVGNAISDEDLSIRVKNLCHR